MALVFWASESAISATINCGQLIGNLINGRMRLPYLCGPSLPAKAVNFDQLWGRSKCGCHKCEIELSSVCVWRWQVVGIVGHAKPSSEAGKTRIQDSGSRSSNCHVPKPTQCRCHRQIPWGIENPESGFAAVHPIQSRAWQIFINCHRTAAINLGLWSEH